ncbi:DUF1707 SHOCT-like domain-containing protein [Bailinhaonella thermotolerans]|uniref:DUF1707 SHOCT-like domain-containing protein n=1 Tax=Bailinhaonella thermotolerans TaxID=1070861 RepID=UPI001F5BFA57|nr:DUF1707 domain-containing protein [Bailinhaonella thermotolerans]
MNSDPRYWHGLRDQAMELLLAGPRARDEAADRLRIGDAERDRTTEALHEHFAAGRLTREELDERLDAALNAKTAGDLRAVTADLPGTGDPGPEHLPGTWGWDAHARKLAASQVAWARHEAHRQARIARHQARMARRRRRGSPPPPAAILGVLFFIGLVAGGIVTGLKIVIFAAIILAVAGLFRHAHRRHHGHQGHHHGHHHG